MRRTILTAMVLMLAAAAAWGQATRPAPATPAAPAPVPVNVTVQAPPVNVTVKVPEPAARPPVTPDEYLAAGRAALAAGNTAEAVRLLESGCLDDPRSISLSFWLGEAYWANLQAGRAVDMFRHLLQHLMPGDPRALERLAMIRKTLADVAAAVKIAANLRAQRLAPQALATLDQIAAAAPVAVKQSNWLLERARCEAALGKPADVLVTLGKLAAAGQTDAESLISDQIALDALVALGRWDQAGDVLRALRILYAGKPLPLSVSRAAARIAAAGKDEAKAAADLAAAVAAAEKQAGVDVDELNAARLLVAQLALAADRAESGGAVERPDTLAGMMRLAVDAAVAVLKSDASQADAAAAHDLMRQAARQMLERGHYAAAVALHDAWLAAADPREAAGILIARGKVHMQAAAAAFAEALAAGRTVPQGISPEEKLAVADFCEARAKYFGAGGSAAAYCEIHFLVERLKGRKQLADAIAVLTQFGGQFPADPQRFFLTLQMAALRAEMAAAEPISADSKLSAAEAAAVGETLGVLTATDPQAVSQAGDAINLLVRIASRYANAGALDAAAGLYADALARLTTLRQADALRLKLAGVYRQLAARQIDEWTQAGEAAKARDLIDAHARALAVLEPVLAGEKPEEAWSVVAQIAGEYESRRGFAAARLLLAGAAMKLADVKLKAQAGERLVLLTLAEGRDVLTERAKRHMGPATDALEPHLRTAVTEYASLLELYPFHAMPTDVSAAVSDVYASRGLWDLAAGAYLAGIEQGKPRKADARFALMAAEVRTRQAAADAARRRVTPDGPLSPAYVAAQAALQGVINQYPGTAYAMTAVSDIRNLADLHRRQQAWAAAAAVLDAFVKANPKAEQAPDFILAAASLQAERATKEFEPDPQADPNDKALPAAFVAAQKAYQAIRAAGGPKTAEAAGGIFRLATFFARQKLWGKAIAIFERFLTDNPEYAKPEAIRFQIALCHLGILAEDQSLTELEAFSRQVDELIRRYEQALAAAAGADPASGFQRQQVDLGQLAADRQQLLSELARIDGREKNQLMVLYADAVGHRTGGRGPVGGGSGGKDMDAAALRLRPGESGEEGGFGYDAEKKLDELAKELKSRGDIGGAEKFAEGLMDDYSRVLNEYNRKLDDKLARGSESQVLTPDMAPRSQLGSSAPGGRPTATTPPPPPVSQPTPVVPGGPAPAEEPADRAEILRQMQAQGQQGSQMAQQVALAQGGGQRDVSQRIAVAMRLDPAAVKAAYDLFAEIIKTCPDTPQAAAAVEKIEQIAGQYASRGEPDRAADVLARFVKDFPRHVRAEPLHLRMASLRLAYAGSLPLTPVAEARPKLEAAYAAAADALRDYVKQHPEGGSTVTAWFAIPEVYQSEAVKAGTAMGDVAAHALLRSADAYAEAAARFPDDSRSGQLARWWLTLADLARRIDRPLTALQLYERLAAEQPASGEARTAALRIADVYEQEMSASKAAAAALLAWRALAGDDASALARINAIAERLRSGSRWSEAIDILEMVVANFPERPEAAAAQLAIGQIYSANQIWPDALEAFRTLKDEFAGSDPARETDRLIAVCYENLSQWDKAAESYREYMKVVGTRPDVVDRLAALAQIAKHQELIDNFPTNEKLNEAQFYLAKLVHERLGNPRKAIAEYAVVVEKYGNRFRADMAQYQIGRLWMELAEYDNARAAFEKLAEVYPNSEWADDALFDLARTYELEAAKLEGQTRQQLVAEQFGRDQKEVVNDAANMRRLSRGGQVEQYKQLQGWMNANPDVAQQRQQEANYWARNNTAEIQLGVTLGNLNDQFAQRPAELTALQVSRLKDRANALLRKAVEAYEQTATRYAAGDKAPDALLRVAQIYLTQLGEKDKGIAAYEQLIAKYPASSKEASAEVGVYYQRQGQFDAAIKAYRQFIYNFPQETRRVEEFYYRIGQALESLNRWTDAIDAYSDYLQRYPAGEYATKAKDRVTWIKQYHQ